MDRFQEMNVLLAVAEAGSFAAAARQLGLSPPGATRAIAALEKRLGTVLLARSTRSVRLTDAGKRYVEDCRRILLELQEAEDLAAGSNLRPRGNLTVTAPVLFGELYMVPLIASYLDSHPEVTVNALLVDRVLNMLDDGVDVAVRIGHLPEEHGEALKVGEVRQVYCASPALLDRIGRPTTPTHLQDAPLVTSSGSSLPTEWQFITAEGPCSFMPQSRLTVSSNNAAIRAACMGWGVARVLSYQVAEHIRSGALQTVLDDCSLPALPIHLLHQGNPRVSAKVRSFLDHCAQRLRADPALN